MGRIAEEKPGFCPDVLALVDWVSEERDLWQGQSEMHSRSDCVATPQPL